MTDQKKKDRGGLTASAVTERGGQKQTQTPETGALIEFDNLYHAVDGFVHANCNFESSIPVNDALAELGKCTDLLTMYAVPIQHKLFTMDSALRWALFLSVAPARAVEEGDAMFAAGKKFSAQGAFELIAGVYDIGVQEAVWDHFEDDEEEGDEADAPQ